MKTRKTLLLVALSSLFIVQAQAQNVGVGQATPIGKLHVTQVSTATVPGIIVDQPGTTTTAGSAATGSIGVLVNSTGAGRGIQLLQSGTGRGQAVYVTSATNTDLGMAVFHSGLGRALNIQSNNAAIADVSAFISNSGTTSGADGIFSGTFSILGGRGVVGTAYVSGTSLSSITESSPTGVQGVAGGGTTNKGISGYAVGGTTQYGGYFSSLATSLTQTTTSVVGAVSSGTNYKVLGITGSPVVSTSREDNNGKKVILFAPESPQPTYSDYGSGQLVNGKTHVTIDPAFAHMIYVNENATNDKLRVFVQLEGDCKGVFVSNKSAEGFDVTELAGGTSNAKFTFQIVANQKNYVSPDGTSTNRLQDIRFPEAPKEESFRKAQKHENASESKN